MKKLEDCYNASFLASLANRRQRDTILGKAIFDLFNPKIVLDVGCGYGGLLEELDKYGVTASGIESNSAVFKVAVPTMHSRITVADLRLPIYWEKKVDLAVCLHVGEHIEEEAVDIFRSNVSKFSDRILFAGTAEPSHLHRLCTFWSSELWALAFEQYNFRQNREKVAQIKKYFDAFKHKPIIKMMLQNLLVLER